LYLVHPDWSRDRLSRELCQVWKRRNPVGQIKEVATRSLLLKLEERAGTEFSARNDGNLEMLAGKQRIVFV
jgi:hypothetical protein